MDSLSSISPRIGTVLTGQTACTISIAGGIREIL
jgi:hypothetical protein